MSFRVSSKADTFEIEEDLDENDSERDSSHFIGILVKCFVLLDKLPYAIDVSIVQVFYLGPFKLSYKTHAFIAKFILGDKN